MSSPAASLPGGDGIQSAIQGASSKMPPGLMQYVMQLLSGGGGASGAPPPSTGGSVPPSSSSSSYSPGDMGNTHIAKQLAQMHQMLYGNPAGPPPPSPAPPPPVPTPAPAPVSQGGFWHGTPNSGMPSPTIANTPSQNSPTTPYSMPKPPGMDGQGAPAIGGPPAPQTGGSVGGGVPPPPPTPWWQKLNIPPSSVSGQKWGGAGPGGNNSWINAMPPPPATGTAIT